MLELLSVSQAGVCELQLPSRCSGGLCFITENAAFGFFSLQCRSEGTPGEGQLGWPNVSCQVSHLLPSPYREKLTNQGTSQLQISPFLQASGSQKHVWFLRYIGVCRHLLSSAVAQLYWHCNEIYQWCDRAAWVFVAWISIFKTQEITYFLSSLHSIHI